MTLWNYLAMFILGLAIFEVCIYTVNVMEEQQDYYLAPAALSPYYTMLVGSATGGLTLSLTSILKLFHIAEQQVKAAKENWFKRAMMNKDENNPLRTCED